MQITPIFNTPYSSRVSDYATSMDVKMQLLINPSDISITNRQVRLKMYLQGNNINAQSTDYVSGTNPIYINGGELLTLTNLDIAALFRLENLQGISPAQYANALPEGMYNVCFEMYDYLTNQRISQKSCAYLYLMLNYPPLLNTPARNESIAVSEFTNILFTWTPRQINATNVSYQFEIKEILDPTIDPQIGFLTSPNLYEETLYSTALLYDISKPNLIAGKRYAWRVRAMSTSGLSLNNVFKNEGYSEIFHFTYASHCPAPTFILSEALSARSVRISWLGDNSHTKYHIQYKKAPPLGAGGLWFEVYTLNTQTTLSDLEAGVTYEFRVGGSCEPAVLGNTASFTYSGINQFSMPAAGTTSSSFTCGLNPAVAIANQTPINNLIVSETFTAGDFPVKILELSDANPVPKPDPITNITNYIHSGQYSGKGYIIVPYLADTKIAVIFNNITVNTNYQLINGIVETSYNPDAPNISDLEDVTGGNNGETVTQTVPFEIVSVTTNPNGDIIVSGPNGEQITIPGGSNTVITGSNGQIYNVDSQGNVTGPFTPAPGGATTPQNTEGVSASGQTTEFTAQGITVTFEPTTTTKYSWDVVPDTAPSYIKDKYAKVGSAYLPYKAVVNGQSDVLKSKITITDTKINKKDLFIKTNTGKLITFDSISNLLTLRGSLSYAEEEVQAVIKQGDKYKVAGAFKLVHLSEKSVNITLVPLNNTSSIPSTASVNLQAIYEKVGVKLTIKTAPVLTYNGGGDNKITTSDSGVFDYYTEEEKAINAQLKALPNYDPKTYYLIYSNLPSDKGIDGFMALGGQFGYIFTPPSGVGGLKTAPHELAHGVFALQHPFVNDSDSSKTPFLMDYGTGTQLWHNDWAQINNPALKFYGFQGDSDGEFTNYVITPDFRIVHIDSYTLTHEKETLNTIPTGTCSGFTTYKYNTNTKEYTDIKRYYWNNTNKRYETKTGEFKVPTTITSLLDDKLISLFYNYDSCPGGILNIKYKDIKTSYNTASGLLSIIDANQAKATPIDCFSFTSTNTDTGSWKNDISVPLDCSVANIQNLIATKLEIIKTGINTITDPSIANTLLKNNYSSCVFESLDLDTRIKILNIFLKDGVDDNTWEFSEGILSLGDKFFIDDIILTTPVTDRLNLLKNGFINHPKWLETLWKEAEPAILNNDIDLDDVTQLISEMGNWVLQNYNQLGIALTQETVIVDSTLGNFQTSTYPKGLLPIFLGSSEDTFSFVSQDGFNYKINVINNIRFNDGKVEFEQNRIGTSRIQSLNSLGQAVYETKYYDYRSKLHPFEPVVLQLGNNYSFLDFGSNDVSNKEIVVPSMLAALYLQKVENKLTEHKVRQLGNGVAIAAAIAATPFTGGGSLAAWSANMAVVGGITATIDIPTQELKQNLIAQNQYDQYKDIFESWETVYNTVAITEGAVGLTQLGVAVKNINRVEAWNKFSSKIKNIPDSSPIQYLKGKWNIIRGFNQTGDLTEDITNFYQLDRALQSKNLVEEYNLTQYATVAIKDEVVAVHRYTVNNFELTGAAYSGTYTTIQQSWMNLIKSCMNKLLSTNKYVGKVYRGSNLSPQNLQPFIDAWQSTSKTIKIPPIQSTSKLESVANHFINKFKSSGKAEVMFEIEVKNGVYIDDISDYGKILGPIRNPTSPIQEEVLLFDNKNFEIKNFQTITRADGTLRHIIEMKEL
ncbi:TPA: hypothetical protein ACGFUW_001412 [Flavobacterium psychrophilum]|nr:hypothetical protein [Flavobacterium psychrophilum]